MRNLCKKPGCGLCWFEHNVFIPVFRDAAVFGALYLLWQLVKYVA